MDSQRQSVINRETLIPIGVICGAVIFLLGGVFWLTMLFSDVQHLKEAVTAANIQIATITAGQRANEDRLLRMEVSVSAILDKVTNIETRQAANQVTNTASQLLNSKK